MLYKNITAYVKDRGIVKTDMRTEKGYVVALGENLANNEPAVTLPDGLLIPGFVDEHIHGADGCDTMDATPEALHKMAKALRKEGTVAFLATTMTEPKENIEQALINIRNFVPEKDEAEIVGVHLEGPFICEKYCGAQPKDCILPPDIAYFDHLQSLSGNKIKIVTVAPEVDGMEAFIRHLAEEGVRVNIGHTNAKAQQVKDAISWGADGVTHTFNAQTPLHHRDIGVAGSALLYDDLYAEAICDGIHLSPDCVRLLKRNKPLDKFILITDAMRAKGLPDGESELGGQKVYVKNGEARLADGTLAGSVLKMNKGVANLVSWGVSLTDAVDSASYNPAIRLNLADYGAIALGKKVNFNLVNHQFELIQTLEE